MRLISPSMIHCFWKIVWFIFSLKKNVFLCHREYGEGNTPKLGWHISFIKWVFSKILISLFLFCISLFILSIFVFIFRSLAEFCRIPVVVTNQVRSQGRDEASRYLFQGIILCSNSFSYFWILFQMKYFLNCVEKIL